MRLETCKGLFLATDADFRLADIEAIQ